MDFKRSILLLEDDLKVISIIQNALKEESYFEVHTARTIKEADEIVKKHRIDLITLDIILPDGDGFIFCSKIKDDPRTRFIKVIVLSNIVDQSCRLTSFNLGADDYLPKPFYPKELLIRIKKSLNINNKCKYWRTVTLDTDKDLIIYKNKSALLTKNEVLIIQTMIDSQPLQYYTVDYLIETLITYEGIRISKNAMVVAINRMCKKLRINLGINLIKSRYGFGYYLSDSI